MDGSVDNGVETEEVRVACTWLPIDEGYKWEDYPKAGVCVALLIALFMGFLLQRSSGSKRTS